MNTLQALQAQRERFSKDIENWRRLERLRALSDWQHVMENGWMQAVCMQCVSDSIDWALDERKKTHALEKARATGFLRQYLDDVVRKGQTAQNSLASLQAAIDATAGEMV